MRRNAIGLILASLLCFFTGCDPSMENKIENKFMEYVQENFDDPSSVDEITNILLVDSFDTKELINLYATVVKTDSFPKPKRSADEMEDLLNRKGHEIENLPEDTRLKLASIIKKSIEIFDRKMTFLNVNGNIMKYLKDSINNYISKIDTANCVLFYTYQIKCRIKEKEDKKLLKYYAIVNAKNGNIRIQDHDLEVKDVPIIDGIYDKFNIYNKLWKEYYDLELEYTKLLNNFSYELEKALNL